MVKQGVFFQVELVGFVVGWDVGCEEERVIQGEINRFISKVFLEQLRILFQIKRKSKI